MKVVGEPSAIVNCGMFEDQNLNTNELISPHTYIDGHTRKHYSTKRKRQYSVSLKTETNRLT